MVNHVHFSETQNEEKENNRQKVLLEKKRKVKLFNETINSIIETYNFIVDAIKAPSDYKFLDGRYMSNNNIRILKRLI